MNGSIPARRLGVGLSLLGVAVLAVVTVVDVSPAAAAGARLAVSAVSASGDDGNVPANAIDGDLATRWSDEGSRPTGDVLAELLPLAGVPASRFPDTDESRGALLRAGLADRRVLLILADAVSMQLVLPLLPGAGGSAVLLTGHRCLTGLPVLCGATTVRVPPLATAEADSLILALNPESAAEPAARGALAELCGYLPLALRVAAARADRPGHGNADAVTELRKPDRLARLSVGTPDPVSVRAGLDVAYGRLDAEVRECFDRLAPLAGITFGVAEARACTGLTDDECERLLDDLVESSMVEAAEGRRYRLPELLGLYARSVTRPPGREATGVPDASTATR